MKSQYPSVHDIELTKHSIYLLADVPELQDYPKTRTLVGIYLKPNENYTPPGKYHFETGQDVSSKYKTMFLIKFITDEGLEWNEYWDVNNLTLEP